MTDKKALHALLVILIFLDVLYDIVIFCSPRTWFPIMRGAPYIDTDGLLRRTAAQFSVRQLFIAAQGHSAWRRTRPTVDNASATA